MDFCNNCLKFIYPSTKKRVEIALHKHICEDCFSKTILQQKDLKEPLEKSLRAIFELYKIKIMKLKKIKVIGQSELWRRGRKIAGGGSPFNIVGMANNQNEILIPRGERKVAALATITHELAHLYQFQNWGLEKVKSMLPYQTEGFCEWLSVRVLEFYKETEEAKKIADNPDTIYGLGARVYLKAEEEGQIEVILSGSLRQ